MGEPNHIREIMERVVSVSLATHAAELKEEIVEQACEQLERVTPAAAPPPPDSGAGTGLLNGAINSILDAFTQVDILAALLEGMSKFAEREALFVVRSGKGTGWRAQGMEHNEGIKAITLDLNAGLASRAFHDRVPAAGSAAEFDSQFVSTYGAPADGINVLVLPLAIRDKVAALIYADAGMHPGGKLDPSALEALVRCTGMWLEIVAARKSGTPSPSDSDTHLAKYTDAPAAEAQRVTAPPPSVTPVYQAPPPSPEPAFAPVASTPAPAFSPETVAAPVRSATAVEPVTPGMSAEEEELHKKARRFAKLLVDEIKLYNQSKVVEGRAHKDIYARLKDDIDKSRATYDRRYGATSAANGNYFTQELIRILANDDPSLLGSGFSG